MNTVMVARGVHWVAIPEAGLSILCGSPADSVKLLMKKGLIVGTQKDGVAFAKRERLSSFARAVPVKYSPRGHSGERRKCSIGRGCSRPEPSATFGSSSSPPH